METDELIYSRYLADHDEADFRILLERHRESLVLFLMNYVHNIDDAEEIMLDAFAEAAAGARFSGKSSFKTWLFSIGKNMALARTRKRRFFFSSVEEEEIDIEDDSSEPPDMEIFKEERKQHLYKALNSLNKEYRQILILLYFEEMSHEEVERVMGKNRKQIYNLAERSKKALKEELERMGFDDAQYD